MTTRDGGPLAAASRVELRRARLAFEQEAAAPSDLPVRSTTPDRAGRFEFPGLGRGSYDLRAVSPGRPPAWQRGVVVVAEERVEAPPIVFDAFAELELTVTPARDPSGAAWNVALGPPGWALDFSGAEREATAGERGSVALRELAPGPRLVEVTSSDGAIACARPLELRPGRQSLALACAPVRVGGVLRAAAIGEAARLHFERAEGARTLARATVPGDPDGRFEAELPGVGRWRIAYSRAGWSGRLALGEREIAASDVDAEPPELVLPDRSLAGRVVDPRGDPVEQLRVALSGLDTDGEFVWARARVDGGGAFVFEGVPAGRFRLPADRPADGGGERPARSARWTIEVEELGVPEPVELVLEAERRVSLRLISEAGPVAGAEVELALSSEGVLLGGGVARLARSNGLGELTIDLPEEADEVELRVAAPGFPLWVRRLRAAALDGGELLLERTAGDFRLAKIDAERLDDEPELVPRTPGGAILLPLELTAWSVRSGRSPLDGDGSRIGRVESGLWSLCRLDAEERAELRWSGSLQRPGRCTSVEVPPGGVAELVSP